MILSVTLMSILVVRSLPAGLRRQFEVQTETFHALRLLVGAALGLTMTGDLDVASEDFYHECWRRKIVIGNADRNVLMRWHAGALSFFTTDTIFETRLRPTQAATIAAFIETIPLLPLDEGLWRSRLRELQRDLEAVAKPPDKGKSKYVY